MRRRGLFIMSLGFIVIMSSPAGKNGTDIRTGLLVLGLTVVAVGFYFFRKDSKYNAQKAAEIAAKAKSGTADETKETVAKIDDQKATSSTETTKKRGNKK